MRLGAALGRTCGSQGLQEHPDLQKVRGLLFRGLGDTGAGVPAGDDEPFGLQGAQRLAYGDAGDAVATREHLFGEAAAALEDTGDDVVTDCRAYRMRGNAHVRTSALIPAKRG